MDDLVTWLRVQLDLDQQHAEKDLWCVERATNGGQWDGSFGYNLPYSVLTADGREIGRLTAMPDGPFPDGAELPHNADLMLVGRMVKSARKRAEQTLREVEAKRRILDLHAPVPTFHHDQPQCEYCASLCHSRSGLGCDSPDAPYPCDTVRLLALPYADRPGYRDEWRPA